jgi:hypothetical protein
MNAAAFSRSQFGREARAVAPNPDAATYPYPGSSLSMTKLAMLTPRRETICSRTTRKPCCSKNGRAVMLASVKIQLRPWPRASCSTAL